VDPDAPKEVEPRFGVPPKVKAFPQDTAKKTTLSVIEAIEKGELSYLVAHLMDPGFVELRVADRAKQYEATVEVELSRLRDVQIRQPDQFRPEDRLPTDRAKFRALIIEKSRERSFRQLVRDVENKLLDDPQALKDIKKLFRDGMMTDTETGAKLTHPDVKDRALFFRKIGDRWFVENRQEEGITPPKKDGDTPPMPKKE
jgi:hypothetical protein